MTSTHYAGRRRALGMLATVPLMGGIPQVVHGADGWPNRPVKLIVPFPAGGATDTVGRVLAQRMQSELGQPIIVENRPGAAGAIGSIAVENSPADGYTLLLGTSSTHSIAPFLTPKLQYDAFGGFTPIVQVAQGPSVLVVSPKLEVGSVADLISYAKRNPGALTYGSSGVGSIPHLNAAYFGGMAGIDMQHIPYKGSSQSYPDLASGRIHLLVDAIVSAMPQVRAGTVKALAVTGARRSSLAPEIPTLAEAGLPDFRSAVWMGLLGPKGIDASTAQAIAEGAMKVLQSAEVKARFAELGVEASALGPSDFAQTISRESDKWKGIIQRYRIAAE